ncbi:MAG: hypothetical protein KDJ38_08460 [Gammaproteobacteria bacterium]|nr:hypothetical protein [Gammaproteobacteria bacterium]
MNSFEESGFSDEEVFVFLLKIYRWDLDHDEHAMSLWELASALEYSNADVLQIAEILHSRGLLDFVSTSGGVSLTSLGTFEVMLALSRPDKATRFFPPISRFSDAGVPVAALKHGSLSGFVSQLRDFCSDLSLSDDVSDSLGTLVDQLEFAIKNGRNPSLSDMSELQAIDQLLTVQLQA